MAPKKQKPSGFMFFTVEWRNKYGKGLTIAEATEEAGKIWKTMDAGQRAPYNEKAKCETSFMGSGGGGGAGKMTCTGVPISLVEKERLDQENKERQMKREIEATVRKGSKAGQLETQTYYFIMANYFTKTLKDGIYVPAEIAVAKFSLKGGVQQVYQTLINPGVNIYGHQYEAQHLSDTTHKLPLPPNALGETQLGKIYNEILNFVRDNKDGNYQPLYTHRDCIHIVESVLGFLQNDTEANNVQLNVYSIQHLLFVMKEATCEAGELEKPKTFYITDAFFDRDFFEYQCGIGCQYHEEIDTSKYCTQSYVTRWGYMFADYMCGDIAIPLMPGLHCPPNTNLNELVTPAPSFYSDTESFISIGTTATNFTKPVAGSKLYYDDDEQKTIVSEASKTYTVNFPNLGGGGGAIRKNTAPSRQTNVTRTIKSSFEDAEYEDCADLNPWTSRSRNIPRQPAKSHFDINYTNDGLTSDTDDYSSVASFGRGRLIADTSFNTISGSSYGRGRFLKP
ncbi:protein maelstrom 1-like [Musca vetustissima]|uniref:protein maelstrom 1-like n=1 Tax=Musca vetustissima TaxID=27455 RepID=UPI002AB7DE73|nr:protein maelstrom 1-like [Musca vetustissima]